MPSLHDDKVVGWVCRLTEWVNESAAAVYQSSHGMSMGLRTETNEPNIHVDCFCQFQLPMAPVTNGFLEINKSLCNFRIITGFCEPFLFADYRIICEFLNRENDFNGLLLLAFTVIQHWLRWCFDLLCIVDSIE